MNERLVAALADRYRIERELGQGGMATVYLAHDIKHDRDVAIKVLREDLAASMGASRFLREIQIAAQLQHPHILPLLDSGEADGFLYYVMPYVTGQSRGMKMNVAVNHPKEREAYELGRKIFFFRGGPHDFGCVTCHGDDNKRIRLQDLPNLTRTADAQHAYGTWPAYRVSQGEVRSFQWRLNDCFRQQRFPELRFTSPASIALTMFLARNANGGTLDAPSIKR